MPVWRCPHCAAPQDETSRCWVCRRSTTSCATCRHFRRGVAGGLGLCGLDPRRLALDGTEMRACWTAAPRKGGAAGAWASAIPGRAPGDAVRAGFAVSAGTAGAVAGGRTPEPSARTFVPVESLAPGVGTGSHSDPGAVDRGPEPDDGSTRAVSPVPVTRVPGTWWLWGDPEPWPDL